MAALYTAHGVPTDEHAYLERFDGEALLVRVGVRVRVRVGLGLW